MREIAGVSVVGTAKNGIEALAKLEQLDPDLLTLDVQMPDMDGMTVLRQLKARGLRSKAIMVSGYTTAGAQVTTDALMEGAFDFILKPSSSDSEANRKRLRDSLEEKIVAFQQSQGQRLTPASRPGGKGRPDRASHPAIFDRGVGVDESIPSPETACRVVIVGTSTGGPVALKAVLPKFPATTPVPILVVQHMPAKYTQSLSARLNEICECEVVEATEGMIARPGQIIVAEGGKQMKMAQQNGDIVLRLTDDPPENGLRPAVDYLLRSAIESCGGSVLAVILTGMGRDGLEGCRALKLAGGFVFAQDQIDCVVYGMPKAVIENGLADRTLTLGKVAPAVLRHLKRSRRAL
jgi:two-component system chemotaxis response regulator CheB